MTSHATVAVQSDAPLVKGTLSTLWVFAMLNYLYADVVTLMDPKALNTKATGSAGAIHITQGFLLGPQY
jgi:hypothetical protein